MNFYSSNFVGWDILNGSPCTNVASFSCVTIRKRSSMITSIVCTRLKANIAKQNRFSFTGTNNIQRSSFGAWEQFWSMGAVMEHGSSSGAWEQFWIMGAVYKTWFFRRPGAERAGSSKNQFFPSLSSTNVSRPSLSTSSLVIATISPNLCFIINRPAFRVTRVLCHPPEKKSRR